MLNPQFAEFLRQQMRVADPVPALKEMTWRLVVEPDTGVYQCTVNGCTVKLMRNCESPFRTTWYAQAIFGQARPYRYAWSAGEALKQLWSLIEAARSQQQRH